MLLIVTNIFFTVYWIIEATVVRIRRYFGSNYTLLYQYFCSDWIEYFSKTTLGILATAPDYDKGSPRDSHQTGISIFGQNQ